MFLFPTFEDPNPQNMIGICPDCTHERKQRLVKGKCPIHNWQDTLRRAAEKKQARMRERQSNYRLNTTPTVLTESDTQQWYRAQIAVAPNRCENCNDVLLRFPERVLFAMVAHIVPKSKFESVKLHPLNRMFLCSVGSQNNCHAKWDASWERASKLPVLSIALKRFDEFKHLIHPSEHRWLPDFLLIRLTNHHHADQSHQPAELHQVPLVLPAPAG